MIHIVGQGKMFFNKKCQFPLRIIKESKNNITENILETIDIIMNEGEIS